MKLLVTLVFICLCHGAWSQKVGVIANTYSHFELGHKNGKIDFVVADTQLNQTKPILLFCQGSQPVPLFVDLGMRGIVPLTLNNFDVDEMNRYFHVVVISMPYTPVKVVPLNLNRSFNYVLDTAINQSFDSNYVRSDNLDNYISRANKVLEYLQQQPWVSKLGTVVVGHSQGARVAVGISTSNTIVSQLGLFGYNPMRRIDQLIWQQRNRAKEGRITWQEADSVQQNLYTFYKDVQNPDSLEKHPEYRSWKSFSKSSLESLANLVIPVYIGYGSEDEIAQYCDQIPLSFIEKQKTNYVLKRYVGLDHDFFPVRANGRTDHANGKWKNVMNNFISWTLGED